MTGAGLLVLAMAAGGMGGGLPAPQPLGQIWSRDGAAIEAVRCQSDIPDGSCRGLALRQGRSVVPLGRGYMRTELLWSRADGGAGPDALVLGDGGGSGGYGDLFAVTLSPPTVRRLNGERIDMARIDPSSPVFRLGLAFDIEYFNGAPHAGATIVRVPVTWRNGDFAADLPALTGRIFSPEEIDFDALAAREELARWAGDAYPADPLDAPPATGGTPTTVRALAELILTGHADRARSLLHRAWPRSHERTDQPIGGEDRFWRALCRAVARQPYWKQLGLDRLPQAGLVEAAAKAG